MKLQLLAILLMVLPPAFIACGQGTFVYDQQSSINETPGSFGGGSTMQQIGSPWGQSFTPDLFLVSFIRLKFNDNNINDGQGVTLTVNLRVGSITGTILSSTDPVVLPNSFSGVANFLFSTPVAVTAGATYYFEPIVQSGGSWNIEMVGNNYPNGTAFAAGNPVPATDFWFREGVVVPEPSVVWLGLVGVGGLAWLRGVKAAKRR